VERSWAVTPGDQAETSATDLVVALARSCGATVLQMSVERHDQAVAAVSHLPQIVASLMAANLTDLPTADLQLAGQGLRDVTRLAASDELMWSQIISSNRQAISGELGRLRDRLDQVLSHLDALGDMVAFIRAGQAGVSRLPGKHGLTRADYRLVVVEIPDSPGALSRLFASIGRAGINIEDISIEHDQHRQVGYLSLAVLADQQSQVEQSLVDDGWNLKV
jgi:prephenate dehydrogenase